MHRDAWRGEGRDVHVYFDNDAEGAAVVNARELIAMVGRAEHRDDAAIAAP